jgi:hypothetical protein
VTKLALSEVSFGEVTIQRLRRVTLDANLLRTLGLVEGDSVDVVLLVDSSDVKTYHSKKIRAESSFNGCIIG